MCFERTLAAKYTYNHFYTHHIDVTTPAALLSLVLPAERHRRHRSREAHGGAQHWDPVNHVEAGVRPEVELQPNLRTKNTLELER